MKGLLEKILKKLKKTPTIGTFNDLYYMCLETKKTDIPLAIEYLILLSDECEKVIASGQMDSHIKELFKVINNNLITN